MTHNELLAKIEENRAFLASQVFDAYPSSDFVVIAALRAVVELHTSEFDCLICTGADGPCLTIQAIEKELS